MEYITVRVYRYNLNKTNLLWGYIKSDSLRTRGALVNYMLGIRFKNVIYTLKARLTGSLVHHVTLCIAIV